MFNWDKYLPEWKKRNLKGILAIFAVWIVFTVAMGFAIGNIPSYGFMLLGFGAYVIACFGYYKLGKLFQHKESLHFKNMLQKECIEEFLKEKGLEEEFKKFAGREL
jgi:hypothetical protein